MNSDSYSNLFPSVADTIRSAFPYQALQRASGEFRILDLHPGLFGGKISCSIRKSSLESKPQYEALSYTWGNARHLKWISLNELDHPITASLELALISS
jgi:hypothetical protein